MADHAYLGAVGAGELARALRRLPEEARRELRPALRHAGQLVRNKAASNASWSTRIPGALSVVTSASGSRPAVAVVARGARAPHARPYEGIAGTSTFRHPVYGGDTWVAQACRPFLAPAVRTEQPAVVAELSGAVGRALGRA